MSLSIVCTVFTHVCLTTKYTYGIYHQLNNREKMERRNKLRTLMEKYQIKTKRSFLTRLKFVVRGICSPGPKFSHHECSALQAGDFFPRVLAATFCWHFGPWCCAWIALGRTKFPTCSANTRAAFARQKI